VDLRVLAQRPAKLHKHRATMTQFGTNIFSEVPPIQLVAALFFAMAVMHTFLAHKIHILSLRFEKNTLKRNLLGYLGDVEVVFGVWAFLLIVVMSTLLGTEHSKSYLQNLNFTEPCFVFVIMAMTATKPVVHAAEALVTFLSKALPFSKAQALFTSTMVAGSLLGSVITEPAAMTVTAMLLGKNFFAKSNSTRFKYATLGLLFVAVSIGGTLTNYAAPPILMVARPWSWSSSHMFLNFGWKSALVISISTLVTCFFFRKEINQCIPDAPKTKKDHASKNTENAQVRMPTWLIVSHLIFVAGVVFFHQTLPFFLALFLIFLGWVEATQRHQDQINLRNGLLVGLFLAGLVTLGGLQNWWLQPLIERLDAHSLFAGATALTAVTDNAALTYLGTLVPNLSEVAKYMLVAGAVTGGGLTVIANAPNPVGYKILSPYFWSKRH
jgi:hypothetical protein